MREPRVLLDATAVPAERGGVGRYVDALVAALDRDGAPITVLCQPRDQEFFGAAAPRARVVPAPKAVAARAGRFAWEQTVLPRLVSRLGVDVVHSPHYTMPLAGAAASVVTLHDATFFTDPALHSSIKARFFRAWTRAALRRATRCVVPSEASLTALASVATVDTDRVDVVNHGIDTRWFHPPTPDEVRAARARIGLDGTEYLAFLGAHEPRKNVAALIGGYVRAVAGRADPPALVLAGIPGWDARIEEAVSAVPGRLEVVRPGYLPLELLAGFLGGARLVVYPSLGEGFGLPVLEAMACGACVVTTRRLALPEVGGDAVAYCGVGADDVATALADLLDDPARRAALGAAAQIRAKEFSWAASARQHRESYDRAFRAHVSGG